MEKLILLVSLSLVFIGCDGTGSEDPIPQQAVNTYVDDNYTMLVFKEHSIMCFNKPYSIFCINSPSTGDIQPTKEYVMGITNELASNQTYTNTIPWYYNNTVYEDLEGDCEDTAMTLVKHMVDDGIDKKYLSLAYQLTSETTAHIFVAVDTVDYGMIHIDYRNSGYTIERINWHMLMTNVGISKWVKGDI